VQIKKTIVLALVRYYLPGDKSGGPVRSLAFHGGGRNQRSRFHQDKGHAACLGAFLKACAEGGVQDPTAYLEVAHRMLGIG